MPNDANLIRAALLCDLPTLRQSGQRGAIAFADAISRIDPRLDSEAEQPGDPLLIAAAAIVEAARGDVHQAQSLLSSPDPLVRLLGFSLIAWLAERVDSDSIENAQETTLGTSRGVLRARLLLKLIGFRLDVGDVEGAASSWRLALKATRPATALRRQLLFIGLNRLPVEVDLREADLSGPVREDPLVELPWIGRRYSEGVMKVLQDLTVASAQSPWTTITHFGRTSLDDLIAADMQATWAGALWLRDPIRLTLASVLLGGAASNPTEVAQAISFWVRNGGKSISPVIDAAEVQFDSSSADYVAAQLETYGYERNQLMRLTEAFAALWDEVSEATAARWLTRLLPEPSNHSGGSTANQVWAALYLRAPDAWEDSFSRLDRPARLAVVSAMAPDLAARLSPAIQEEALDLLLSEDEATNSQPDLAMLRAELQTHAAKASSWKWVGSATPLVISRLSPRYGKHIPRATIQRALTELASSLESEASDALAGKRTFWSVPIASQFASLLWIAPAARRDAGIELLIRQAQDSRLPADLRLDALRALHHMTMERALTRQWLDPIAEISARGRDSFLERVSNELLDSLRDAILVVGEKRSEVLARLLVYARSPDARVRQIAMEAVWKRARDARNEVIACLLAGLSDPSPVVVAAAARATMRISRVDEVQVPVLGERLFSAFNSQTRSVRAAAVAAAIHLASASISSEALVELLNAARSDRSWLVRDALELSDRL